MILLFQEDLPSLFSLPMIHIIGYVSRAYLICKSLQNAGIAFEFV